MKSNFPKRRQTLVRVVTNFPKLRKRRRGSPLRGGVRPRRGPVVIHRERIADDERTVAGTLPDDTKSAKCGTLSA